jgi:tRNA dimethylallyltransferase
MLLALVGPTATGKTEAGLAIAESLGAEILSVDSMLVYCGMSVGTAKPTSDQRARVPHHLLDLAEPSERFTVARFQEEARLALATVERPLLVGGSGLYFRAIVDDLEFPPEDRAIREELEREAVAVGPAPLHRRLIAMDPVAASRIDPGNVRRTVRALEVAAITGERFSDFAEPWIRYDAGRVRVAGIQIDREILGARIERRVQRMIDGGWRDEVRALVDRGYGAWLTSTQAIGYSEFALELDGRLSHDEAVARTVKRTKELARRQEAWFNRDPRVRWFATGSGGALDVADPIRLYLEDR